MKQPTLQPDFEGDYLLGQGAPFPLDSGATLPQASLHYAIYGKLNEARDNAILACHALTGSARVADWWQDLFHDRHPLDADKHCVIGINVLGSCYGSTGPRSINPTTGKPYGAEFPVVSIRDIVRAQAELIQHLGIRQLRAVLGGSIGGMQALQWTVDFPDRVAGCFSVGAAPLSAMGLALNHLQREIIRLDPAWNGGEYDASNPPTRGLALARGLAVCTYKSPALFTERFGRKPDRSGEDPLQSHARTLRRRRLSRLPGTHFQRTLRRQQLSRNLACHGYVRPVPRIRERRRSPAPHPRPPPGRGNFLGLAIPRRRCSRA